MNSVNSPSALDSSTRLLLQTAQWTLAASPHGSSCEIERSSAANRVRALFAEGSITLDHIDPEIRIAIGLGKSEEISSDIVRKAA